MVKVKICGITNLDDALAAADFGADALGFVFFKKSPRYISVSNAKSIIEQLPPYVTPVGLFVNETKKNIEKIAQQTGITTIQLHGDEPPKSCTIKGCKIIKAIRIASDESLELFKQYSDVVSAFLLDAYTEKIYGGTAQKFDWDIARKAKKFGRIILAGGLTPENVREAIVHVQPFAVDVSSGVEKQKGKKDHKKMQLFIERSKRIGRLL